MNKLLILFLLISSKEITLTIFLFQINKNEYDEETLDYLKKLLFI